MNGLYDIRSEDIPLIEACIGLGGWLLENLEVTDEERDAIHQILKFLHNLPDPAPEHLNADFGFRLELDDPNMSTWNGGEWSVSLYRDIFEIFSNVEDDSNEFWWLIRPGAKNIEGLHNADLWIQQVSDPFALEHGDYRVAVDASIVK